jgi:hypothetical protein
VQDRATSLVREYLMRRHLAKIGLVSDISRMPFAHAMALEEVGNEFDRLEVAEMKKKSKAAGSSKPAIRAPGGRRGR